MILSGLDYDLFSAINGWHSVPVDHFMEFISSKSAAIPMYVLLALVLWNKYKMSFGWIVLAVVLLILASDQFSVFIKFYVERLRPCHDPLLSSSIHLVNNHCGGEFGFYSSHASNTAALAVFISHFIRNKYLWIFLGIWVFLVGYSRIYLGAHFPLDILTGWTVGSLMGWGMARLTNRFVQFKQNSVST